MTEEENIRYKECLTRERIMQTAIEIFCAIINFGLFFISSRSRISCALIIILQMISFIYSINIQQWLLEPKNFFGKNNGKLRHKNRVIGIINCIVLYCSIVNLLVYCIL